MSKKVLLLESGGSKFISGVVEGGDTEIKGKNKVAIDQDNKTELIEDMFETMWDSLETSGVSIREIDSVGVISAGIWNYERGVVHPPNLPFKDKFLPLGKKAKEEFEKPVYVENDVNAAVKAEATFGYGKENDVRFLGYLTISTGIGLGLLDSKTGELVSGEKGKAPEVGHNVIVPEGLECGCGGKGHWEAYASGEGMCRLAKKLSNDPNYSISTKKLLEKAKKGNKFSQKVIERVAYYNAIGIGHIINQYQPGAIIVGGTPVIEYPELVLDPIVDLLNNPPRKNEFTYIDKDHLPDIKKTELGCDNVAYGAASVAINGDENKRVC